MYSSKLSIIFFWILYSICMLIVLHTIQGLCALRSLKIQPGLYCFLLSTHSKLSLLYIQAQARFAYQFETVSQLHPMYLDACNYLIHTQMLKCLTIKYLVIIYNTCECCPNLAISLHQVAVTSYLTCIAICMHFITKPCH